MLRGWTTLGLWLTTCAWASVFASGWPTDNRVGTWVGQTGEDSGYSVLRDRFGGDEWVQVRVDGPGVLDEPEWVGSLGMRLASEPAVQDVVDPLDMGSLGAAALVDLAARPLVRALDLIDPDPPRVDLLLAVDPATGTVERERLAAALEGLTGEAEERGVRLRSAGHPLVAAALDREAERVERVFAPLLVLLAFCTVAAFLRSFALGTIAILPAILASSGSRACLRWMGIDSDMVLVACGPLTFVLLLASSLHVVVAFRRRLALHGSPTEAAAGALREKRNVALLAALTTAVGFGVFLMSGLRSVAALGSTVAGTVLVAVPLMLLGLRPLLGGLPLRRPRRAARGSRGWRTLASAATRHRLLLGLAAALVLVLGASAPLGFRWQTNALYYFPRDDALRSSFLSIEAEGGALSSAEVLVRREGGRSWRPAELGGLDLTPRLRGLDGVRGCFGPDDVLEEVTTILGPTSIVGLPLALERAGRLGSSGEWARWTVRFPTMEADPTRILVERIRTAAAAWGSGRGLEVQVAGSVQRMLDMQRMLLGTLAKSLAWTVLATTLLFLFAVRSARELVVALLVNLVPVATVLAAARILAIPLDAATVMVAAVVLGLAVDNTFHLMHAAGSGDRGARACLRAFQRVGEPAALSSLALALGFLTLAFSGFAPTARFGLLAAIGSVSALGADLLLLPALWIRPSSGP